jgi:glycosyltransferase involved in cell wall biosynthesis
VNRQLAVVVPVFNEPAVARTLAALHRQDRTDGIRHFLIDNGSTDGTRARVDAFRAAHPEFPLTVLAEDQKGTGAASDTGFRRAIADGFPLIARTDADSVPRPDWTARICRAFAAHPGLALLGGRSVPLRDAYWRAGDGLLLPAAFVILRGALALSRRDPAYLRLVAGHNLATAAPVYERAGGFPRTSIDERDEDIEYTLRVAGSAGRRAILIDPGLVVETSMRRIRAYGLGRMALRHLAPDRRTTRGADPDVR